MMPAASQLFASAHGTGRASAVGLAYTKNLNAASLSAANGGTASFGATNLASWTATAPEAESFRVGWQSLMALLDSSTESTLAVASATSTQANKETTQAKAALGIGVALPDTTLGTTVLTSTQEALASLRLRQESEETDTDRLLPAEALAATLATRSIVATDKSVQTRMHAPTKSSGISKTEERKPAIVSGRESVSGSQLSIMVAAKPEEVSSDALSGVAPAVVATQAQSVSAPAATSMVTRSTDILEHPARAAFSPVILPNIPPSTVVSPPPSLPSSNSESSHESLDAFSAAAPLTTIREDTYAEFERFTPALSQSGTTGQLRRATEASNTFEDTSPIVAMREGGGSSDALALGQESKQTVALRRHPLQLPESDTNTEQLATPTVGATQAASPHLNTATAAIFNQNLPQTLLPSQKAIQGDSGSQLSARLVVPSRSVSPATVPSQNSSWSSAPNQIPDSRYLPKQSVIQTTAQDMPTTPTFEANETTALRYDIASKHTETQDSNPSPDHGQNPAPAFVPKPRATQTTVASTPNPDRSMTESQNTTSPLASASVPIQADVQLLSVMRSAAPNQPPAPIARPNDKAVVSKQPTQPLAPGLNSTWSSTPTSHLSSMHVPQQGAIEASASTPNSTPAAIRQPNTSQSSSQDVHATPAVEFKQIANEAVTPSLEPMPAAVLRQSAMESSASTPNPAPVSMPQPDASQSTTHDVNATPTVETKQSATETVTPLSTNTTSTVAQSQSPSQPSAPTLKPTQAVVSVLRATKTEAPMPVEGQTATQPENLTTALESVETVATESTRSELVGVNLIPPLTNSTKPPQATEPRQTDTETVTLPYPAWAVEPVQRISESMATHNIAAQVDTVSHSHLLPSAPSATPTQAAVPEERASQTVETGPNSSKAPVPRQPASDPVEPVLSTKQPVAPGQTLIQPLMQNSNQTQAVVLSQPTVPSFESSPNVLPVQPEKQAPEMIPAAISIDAVNSGPYAVSVAAEAVQPVVSSQFISKYGTLGGEKSTIASAVRSAREAGKSSAGNDRAVQLDRILAQALPTGPTVDSSATVRDLAVVRGPVESQSALTTEPDSREAFATLDTTGAPGRPSWVHAGTRQAEAGFQDPSLGWIGVRAESSGGGVHAQLVPGSADAAQVLGGHMAGLSAYLAEHHTPVDTLTLSTPDGGGTWLSSNSGAGEGMQQGANHQAGQETAQSTESGFQSGVSGGPTIQPAAISGLPAFIAGQDRILQASEILGGHISVMA